MARTRPGDPRLLRRTQRRRPGALRRRPGLGGRRARHPAGLRRGVGRPGTGGAERGLPIPRIRGRRSHRRGPALLGDRATVQQLLNIKRSRLARAHPSLAVKRGSSAHLRSPYDLGGHSSSEDGARKARHGHGRDASQKRTGRRSPMSQTSPLARPSCSRFASKAL